MAECPNCGAQLSDQDVFCGECGIRVADGPVKARPVDDAFENVEPAAPPMSEDTAKARGKQRQRIILLIAAGCGVVLVALMVCIVLGVILLNQDDTGSGSISLGGSPVPTRAPYTGAPDASPAIEETFDDNSRDWSAWEDEHGEKGLADGVYFITVTDTEWASWSTSEALMYDDFVMEVETRAVEGPDDNGYGVVFRYLDNANFYYYEISSDGYFSVGKLLDDEWETLVSWTESDLIRQGRETNVLRVICEGPSLAFFVNGYQLTEVVDADFGAGGVGFLAEARDEPGVRVHFDNLRIWPIE